VCHINPNGNFVDDLVGDADLAGRKIIINKTAVPEKYLDDETVCHINANGNFVDDLVGDAGLAGRKIIIDTYSKKGKRSGDDFSG